MIVSTDLESQRRSVALLSKPDLSTGPFGCQIALLDKKAWRPFQVVWQPFDRKFSFNFAIVSRRFVLLHKLNIVGAMRSVSRLSHFTVSEVVPTRTSKRHPSTDIHAAAR